MDITYKFLCFLGVLVITVLSLFFLNNGNKL